MYLINFYSSFRSAQSEQEIFPSEDRFKSVHTKIILIESQVSFSIIKVKMFIYK